MNVFPNRSTSCYWTAVAASRPAPAPGRALFRGNIGQPRKKERERERERQRETLQPSGLSSLGCSSYRLANQRAALTNGSLPTGRSLRTHTAKCPKGTHHSPLALDRDPGGCNPHYAATCARRRTCALAEYYAGNASWPVVPLALSVPAGGRLELRRIIFPHETMEPGAPVAGLCFRDHGT